MKQNREKRTLIVPESLINRAEMLRFKMLQSQGVGIGAGLGLLGLLF